MNRQKTADQALVRKLNTSIVMEKIRLEAPLSRAELSYRTGLNRSTVSSIIGDLIDLGYVHETTLQDPKIGRPGMLLHFNPDAGCAIGVEIGVDFISIVLTNFVAKILWRRILYIDAGEQQIAIIECAERLINEAMEFCKSNGVRPLGIGVAAPGLVDVQQGKLVYAPNLKWIDIPIRLMWERRFDLPVFVENEANCAALAEHFYGVSQGVNDFLYLKTDIGLGGGIMIGGRLFKGTSGFAGEIGHITIYKDGEQCACGRRGCWETYVRPRAVLDMVRQALQGGAESIVKELVKGDLSKINLDVVLEAARQNDPVALRAFQEIGTHLAVGITNLINIFNPELVVLGGALSLAGNWVIPVIQQYIQENVLLPLRGSVRIEGSAHGLDACVLGAIALVLDNVVREPLK